MPANIEGPVQMDGYNIYRSRYEKSDKCRSCNFVACCKNKLHITCQQLRAWTAPQILI